MVSIYLKSQHAVYELWQKQTEQKYKHKYKIKFIV